MRNQLILLLLLVLACSSGEPKHEGVPKAFEQGSSIDLKRSGRYDRDVVEDLFSEALEKDSSLRRSMDLLDLEQENALQRLKAFNEFTRNMNDFNGSAEAHLELVSDSLLKKGMTEQIIDQRSDHLNRIADHARLASEHEKVERRNEDLVELIKLKTSLQMMKEYENDHWPDKKILQQQLEEIKRLEKRLEAEAGL